MNEEQALEVWRELSPLPASLLRLRFNGRTDPVYSVSVNAHEMSGRDLNTIIKIADARDLELYVRANDNVPEIVLTRRVTE